MAASPLLTSAISKLPSAKVCLTRRRMVGLSSANRIFRFIRVHNNIPLLAEEGRMRRAKRRRRRGGQTGKKRFAELTTPSLRDTPPLRGGECSSPEFLCGRLARLLYYL